MKINTVLGIALILLFALFFALVIDRNHIKADLHKHIKENARLSSQVDSLSAIIKSNKYIDWKRKLLTGEE